MTTPNIQALIASIERIRVELGEVSQGLAALAGTAAPSTTPMGSVTARVFEKYWSHRHAGTLESVNQARIADELDVPASSVRRIWSECKRGLHADPLTYGRAA